MIDVKNICILGAGNVGIASAVDLSLRNYNVTLLTSKADKLEKDFTKIDIDTNQKSTATNINVTNNYDKALNNCDLCIITVPSFMIEDTIARIKDFFPKIILFTPGYGDKHKYCNKLIKKGCIITGFDRSPYICRLIDANTVNASKKSQIRVGAVNYSKITEIAELYSNMFDFKVIALPNYLTVNFTPSNPILHTSRLYSMFKDYNKEHKFDHMIKFYAEWTDDSSEVMLAMDNELQEICRAIENKDKIDLSMVVPLTVHYESPTVKLMTNKITSIKSFKNIDAPMIKTAEGCYLVDWNSRYFKEDFPFGLAILKKYAQQYKVNTPFMDKVLNWFYSIE